MNHIRVCVCAIRKIECVVEMFCSVLAASVAVVASVPHLIARRYVLWFLFFVRTKEYRRTEHATRTHR